MKTITKTKNPLSFMKALVLAVVLLGLSLTNANAQTTVIIGSNSGANSTTGYPCPIQDYYYASRIQILYNAASMAGIPSGSTITQIGWVANATTISGHLQEGYTLQLKNTSITSVVTTAWETGLTTVKTAANYAYTSGTAGNIMFTLTTPFVYTGGGLLIEACGGLSTGGYTSNPACQYQTLVGYNATHQWRADAVNGCGNATLTNTGTQTTRPRMVITYTGGAACSGTPAPGNTLPASSTACSGVSFTLTLQNSTSGSGVSYQWQSSADNITFANISGQTGTTLTTTQTSTTYYRCTVTCSGGGTGISNSAVVTQNSPTACYCTVTGGSATYYIGNVTITGGVTNFNQTSTTSASGYTDYSASVSCSQLQSSAVNYSISTGPSGNTFGIGIWVDWNQNGSFTDAGENVYNSAAYVSSAAGSFTVPATATGGSTRMRVCAGYIPSTAVPCTPTTYTEYEDYTFTVVVPTACSGTPAASTTVTSSGSVCSGVNFTLSLGTSYAFSGISYQWQADSGSGYANISGATSSTRVGSQAVATSYRCIITCSNSGLSATSTPVSVAMNAALSCYCTPPQSSSYACCAMYMSNVNTTLGVTNFNQTSTEGAASYQNYSATQIGSQVQNSNVTMNVTTNGYGMYMKVWIDFNDNGLFTDAGEQVLGNGSTPGTFGGTTIATYNQTFTVPAAAPAGTHRMRVRAEYYGNGVTTPADPCGQLTYGETEDYGFTVIANSNCAGTPNTGTASASAATICGSGTSTISLTGATSGTGISYQWQLDSGSGFANISGATTTSYTTPTLTTAATNNYRCVTTCSFSGLSATSTSATVTVYGAASISPSSISLCNGASATATASPSGATYLWTGGQTTAAKSISASGTYTCTVTQGTCVQNPTVVATVSALPTMGTTSASVNPVCSGSNTVLTTSATAAAGGSYCVPTVSNGCSFPDIISNVTVGSINRTSTCDNLSGSNGYSNFPTSTATSTYAAGTPTSISVTTSGDIEGAMAWIDYNQDGSFTSGEIILPGANAGTNPATYTGSFTVPTSALNGTTRMRIRCIYNANPTSLTNPACDAVAYGEVEDYTVTITGGTNAITYAWSPSTFLASTTGATVNANAVTAATTYTATATQTSTGCSNTGTVAVTLNTAPVISAHSNVTQVNDAGVCGAVVSYSAASVSGSPTPVVTYSQNSGTLFSGGNTTVTITATNTCGTVTSTFTVTVNDVEPPVITVPAMDMSVVTDGAGNTTAFNQWLITDWGNADATDNCTDAAHLDLYWLNDYSASNWVTDCGTAKHVYVGFYVYDQSSNNSAWTYATFYITDAVAPTISVPATANLVADAGMCSSSAAIGTATGSDVGSAVTITNNNPGPYTLGANTVVWTATDACGNATTGSQTVNVTDNQNPTITAPSAVTANTNTGCTATGVSLGSPSTGDNCSVAGTSNDAPAAYPLGATTVTWTVTDGSGNTATATQTVTVSDNVNPTITAPSDVTVCNGASISLGSPITNDNCSVASTTNDAPGSYSVGTTVVTWTVTDGSGNTATATQNVTVNPLPTAIVNPQPQVICNGAAAGLSLTDNMGNTCSFTWTTTTVSGTMIGNNACSSGCGTNIADVLTNLGTTTGAVSYSVTAISPLGCASGAPTTAVVTIGVTPATPAVINGPNVVCGLTSATYYIASVPDATTYTWTLPTGPIQMNILSGQGTTQIVCSVPAGSLAVGNVTVTAGNSCGTSTPQSMAITKKPQTPGAISGPTSTCSLTTATWSIASVFGATSYAWTVPTGMTIASGAGTTQISVNIASTFITGQVKVSAVNACGNVPGVAITVTGNIPAVPLYLYNTTNVCGVSTVNFSCSVAAGATNYVWTVPAQLSITSGQGTTAIACNINSTPVAGSMVSVVASNVCGNAAAKTSALVTTSAGPGVITGPTNVCSMTTATYSIAAVAGAVSYTWTPATGMTITSGQGTTSIVVAIAASSGTLTASSYLKVTATNGCGVVSTIRQVAVTRCLSAQQFNTGAGADDNTYSAVYPNPTSADFTIDVTSTLDKEVTLEVYDVLGNLVISQKHQIATGTSTLNTNIENYKAGLYFVRLVNDAATVFSQTVIKQ